MVHRRQAAIGTAAAITMAVAGGFVRAADSPAGTAPASRPAVTAIRPDLEADPKVLAILDGLGENESALLPPVRTAGAINEEQKKFRLDKVGPRPRNYCLKWVWAPDRKRAMFCGANAGVPHRFNDVWEYDLAANTWICLWEPDPDIQKTRGWDKPKRYEYIEKMAHVKDGVLMTKRGAPFDPVHTWWGMTYDPDIKAVLWVVAVRRKASPALEAANKVDSRKMKLWAYYPEQNRWEFQPQTASSPPCQNASNLDYIPDLHGAVWYTSSSRGHAMSVFNAKSRTWLQLLPSSKIKDNADCPRLGCSSAYDSKNQVLVAYKGQPARDGRPALCCTHHYDVRTNTWKKVIESAVGPLGGSSGGPMTYDSVAKRCFILSAKNGLWSYGVGDKAWSETRPDGPRPVISRSNRYMFCYNPQYNVLMADNGSGRAWVYRARQRAAAVGPPSAE